MTVRETLTNISRTGTGIFSLVTPFPGLLEQTLDTLKSRLKTGDREWVIVDGRREISTPLLWATSFLKRFGLTPTAKDNRSHLESCFRNSRNRVVIIDDAGDLFALARYPGCRDLVTLFMDSVPSDAAWVLTWPSQDRIPGDLITSVTEIPPMTPETVRNHLETLGFDFPVDIIGELTVLTGGIPDALSLLLNTLPRDIHAREIRSFLDTVLLDHKSPLAVYCRNRWLNILNTARGYTALKAIMDILAGHPDIRLTDVADAVHNSLPAVRDYLKSLITVGAVMRRGWRYRLTDPILAQWLRLTSPFPDTAAPIYESAPVALPEAKPTVPEPKRYAPQARNEDFLEFD